MVAEQKNSGNGHKAEIWTRVITGCAGAALLGMQGINISETNGQTNLIERIDRAIKQQSDLVKGLDQEGKRVDQALANQQQMIESMETLLHNQQTALDLLAKKSP